MELTRTLAAGPRPVGLCVVGRLVVDLSTSDPDVSRQLDEWTRVPPRTVDADGPTPSAKAVHDWLVDQGHTVSAAMLANHRAALTNRAKGHCSCTAQRVDDALAARRGASITKGSKSTTKVRKRA